jgi:hypothetical protein
MGLSNDVRRMARARPLALTSEITMSLAKEEQRLLGSRRLHKWFSQRKLKSVETELKKREAAASAAADTVGSAEVQPMCNTLVTLMSKRRLTEYHLATMGSATEGAEDSGAAFLQRHLKGVPDVLTVRTQESDSNTQEHVFERV